LIFFKGIGRRLAEQKIYLILIKVGQNLLLLEKKLTIIKSKFYFKLLKNHKIEYVGKEMKSKFRLVFAPNQALDLKFTKRK
jgi:hypothetical protein